MAQSCQPSLTNSQLQPGSPAPNTSAAGSIAGITLPNQDHSAFPVQSGCSLVQQTRFLTMLQAQHTGLRRDSVSASTANLFLTKFCVQLALN